MRLDQPPSRGRPVGAAIPAQVNWLTITDDRGTAATARFSGGGGHGDPAWHGQYQPTPLLAADTAWIELLGERIELPEVAAASAVRIEPLPAQDPAVRHLWDRVATLNDFHDPHSALDATIAALVAAGALYADAKVIGQARAVLAALRPPSTAHPAHPERSAHPLPVGDPPGPWLSLLTRWGMRGGPEGSIPVGARTTPFDGVSAGVIALRSHDYGFGISVELVPGARVGLPYRDLPDQPYLTWWAADDLGNHYLGEHGSWNAGDHWAGGAISFWPALDPRASRVDLMPTGMTARAVIGVPLRWADP